MLPADAPKLARVRLIHAIVSTRDHSRHQPRPAGHDHRGRAAHGRRARRARLVRTLSSSTHVPTRIGRASTKRSGGRPRRWRWRSRCNWRGVATDATLLLARLDERAGNPDAAKAAMTKAIAEAAAAGEQMAELRGLYNLASLDYGQGRLTEALALFQKAAAKARDNGRPVGAVRPRSNCDRCDHRVRRRRVGSGPNGSSTFPGRTRPSRPRSCSRPSPSKSPQVAARPAGSTRCRGFEAGGRADGLIAITSGGAAIELYGYLGDIDTATAMHAESRFQRLANLAVHGVRGPRTAGGLTARATRKRSFHGDRHRA